jgi:uncharacterized protein YceK
MHNILVVLSVVLLLAGCSGNRSIRVPSSETNGEWVSEVRKDAANGQASGDKTSAQIKRGKKRMYVRKKEKKYVIKDEPYSIASKKKDPELLGPQRTYDADATSTVKKTRRRKRKNSKMTKESCISLIGEAKYNKYVQRYGGETGALRRCLVLKRLRG